MGRWLRRIRVSKSRPHAALVSGIYFRDTHNQIYWLPNTWKAGIVIEFVMQTQGFVLNGFRRGNETLPPQKLYTLDRTLVSVPLMELKDWWEQRFVGETSEDPLVHPPSPQAPGASRAQPFPIAER